MAMHTTVYILEGLNELAARPVLVGAVRQVAADDNGDLCFLELHGCDLEGVRLLPLDLDLQPSPHPPTPTPQRSVKRRRR